MRRNLNQPPERSIVNLKCYSLNSISAAYSVVYPLSSPRLSDAVYPLSSLKLSNVVYPPSSIKLSNAVYPPSSLKLSNAVYPLSSLESLRVGANCFFCPFLPGVKLARLVIINDTGTVLQKFIIRVPLLIL